MRFLFKALGKLRNNTNEKKKQQKMREEMKLQKKTLRQKIKEKWRENEEEDKIKGGNEEHKKNQGKKLTNTLPQLITGEKGEKGG